jgi:hypothetical protein
MPDICTWLGYFAIQVREVPGVRAGVGDQGGQALMLAPGDALCPCSGCIPGIPGSCHKTELSACVVLLIVHVHLSFRALSA